MTRAAKPGAGSTQDWNLRPDAFLEPKGVDWLARTVLDIFYRKVTVQGVDQVPRSGGVVFVGNHVSGLLDPAIFMAYLPRRSRFLGKSTLWKIVALRPFLKLAAAIPVYRRQDPGVDQSKNADTFARCHQALAAGGTIALFPEGRSHNEPALVPLKTGVARIVLQSLYLFPGLEVSIVPVGLTFDDKTRFRSRLLVKVGEPIRPASPPDPESEAFWQAALELTEQVREGLEAVTLNYPSWEEARLIERAASIFARPVLEAPAEQALADAFATQQIFIDGYEKLLEVCPDEVHRVAAEVKAYDLELASLRLRDEQVAARYTPEKIWQFTLKSLLLICFRLPLGALGSVIHYVPYRLTGLIASRLTDSPDVASTYKVFPALVLYPLNWIIWAVIGWASVFWVFGQTDFWTGAVLAATIFLVGPITGYFAIQLHQRTDLFLEQARAFLLLRSSQKRILALKQRRLGLVARVGELAEAYRRSGPS